MKVVMKDMEEVLTMSEHDLAFGNLQREAEETR